MSDPRQAKSEPLDQASGLLPVDPPARGARWAGWLLLAVAVAAAVFSVTFPLPETVVAPFVLVPAEGEDPVQAPLSGEIAAVSIREGETVKAGQELFRVRSDEIRNAGAKCRQLTEDDRALGERIRRLNEAHRASLGVKDAELVQAERELAFRDQHLATVRDIVRRSEQLAAAGSVSAVEMLSHKLAEAESLKNRAVAEKLVQQLMFQRQELVAARALQCSDERAEGEKLRVQLATLGDQLRDSRGDVKSVRAPYDAVVLRVMQRTPGGIVAAGAELCHLARADSRPRARLMLPETGVPRLAIGQQARLFVTSYPYQRHGTIAARITWLSPAPVTVGNEHRFIAVADWAPMPSGPLQLRVGMNGEARVLVSRQTLLERATEPLRGLRERLRSN